MEWLAQLQGQIVGLDTAPLIYLVEENPSYLDADAVFEAIEHLSWNFRFASGVRKAELRGASARGDYCS